MKKIILILTAVLLLSCEQIDSVISYFVELSADTTTGTTDTVFYFDIDTNDDSYILYCNNEILESNRSTGYTFDSGDHEIKVVTSNGKEDSINISVEYNTRFIITENLVYDTSDSIHLNYPTLELDGTYYNVETMTPDVEGLPVKTSYTDTERLVYITMDILIGRDSILFHSNNMIDFVGFTEDELTVENMELLIEYFNEDEIPPEETFTSVKFNLLRNETDNLSTISFTDDSYILDGVETIFQDAEGTIVDDVKTINITVNIESHDDFIARGNGALELYFELTNTDIDSDTFLLIMDILDMYDGSNLLDVIYYYNPDHEILVEYGYVP